jgi:asparagine synthase (glutamine-hydrolysing)
MCGIAGVFHADRSRPVDPDTLVAMAAIQYHRGPDGFGWKAMDGIGMSHARLSIIDLDENRGRQPFVSADDRLLLAQNGEFYDYKRIRAELTARGARFETKSDSEILLHLVPRLGLEKSLPHLRGEFAFAIYDRDADELWLVRDRFGIKPLYYAEVGDTFVFGSELKVLFAHPEVPRRFDSAGLYHQLMQTIVPGTTAFAGIRQVPPGHLVRVRRRDGRLEVEERRYWDIAFPEAGGHADLSDDEAIDAVRSGLLEAVHLRLEADVPVGCYLSGGIDSCSILGLASAAMQSPVKAFTIGFDSAEYDETPIAREMAESVGADQDVLRLDATALYDHFEETLWHTSSRAIPPSGTTSSSTGSTTCRKPSAASGRRDSTSGTRCSRGPCSPRTRSAILRSPTGSASRRPASSPGSPRPRTCPASSTPTSPGSSRDTSPARRSLLRSMPTP